MTSTPNPGEEPFKILIVEDDSYIRELYQETLESAGYKVNTTPNGEEGLLKIREEDYSLALLDMMMPKVDGLSFLKDLKKNPPAHPCPIIVLTNLGHDPVIQEALTLGAKKFFVKTDLNPDELIQEVTRFLLKEAAKS